LGCRGQAGRPVHRTLRHGSGSGYRPHQLAVRNLLVGVEADPLSFAPTGVKPAGEEREVLLALAHGEPGRFERGKRLTQLAVERNGAAFFDGEAEPLRLLPIAGA